MWATCEKPLVCLRGSCVKADGRWWDAHGISAARMGPGLLSAALQEARVLRNRLKDWSTLNLNNHRVFEDGSKPLASLYLLFMNYIFEGFDPSMTVSKGNLVAFEKIGSYFWQELTTAVALDMLKKHNIVHSAWYTSHFLFFRVDLQCISMRGWYCAVSKGSKWCMWVASELTGLCFLFIFCHLSSGLVVRHGYVWPHPCALIWQLRGLQFSERSRLGSHVAAGESRGIQGNP